MKAYTFLFLLALSGSTLAQNFSAVEQVMLNNQRSLGDDQVLLIYKDGKILYQKSLAILNPIYRRPLAKAVNGSQQHWC